MERLRPVGDYLKRNKDIIQPLTTLTLCILVAILYFLPGRNTTVTIVQTTPPTNQTTGTPTPDVQEVESATTSLPPSDIYTNAVTPESLERNNRQPSGSSGSTSGGSNTTPKPTTPPAPTILCENVTSGSGTLSFEYDLASMLNGDKFSVSIKSPSSVPLGSIFMVPTGDFLVSPSTLSSTSTSASFIAQYEGGYIPGGDTTPTDAINVTARCGGATFTGAIALP